MTVTQALAEVITTRGYHHLYFQPENGERYFIGLREVRLETILLERVEGEEDAEWLSEIARDWGEFDWLSWKIILEDPVDSSLHNNPTWEYIIKNDISTRQCEIIQIKDDAGFGYVIKLK